MIGVRDHAGERPAAAGHAREGARVEIRELTKHYGKVVAVDGVSFDIQPGEFITLLGPSGSGKTTTLMMIAGFVLPTDGQILVGGDDIAFRPPHKRNIGMVFQNYALFPHMTVADNVGFPLKMRKWPGERIRSAVEDALTLVRLAGYGERHPRQLSGGQQQRVALARALVFQPPVLLMDEPLGALDKKLREEMQLEIKHIQARTNITTFYVTHDQEEALTMSDRIAVMNHGRIEQIGTPTDLYDRPVNSFVADFIGESNFVSGALGQHEGERVVMVEGGLRVRPPRSATGGERIVLALRPERVVVANGRAVDNRFSAEVEEVIYIGETTKLRVRLPNGQPLTLKQQNRTDTTQWARGDQLEVGWNADDAVVVTGSDDVTGEAGLSERASPPAPA